MRSSHKLNHKDLFYIASTVNPDNIIPALEQHIEIEKLKLNVSNNTESRDKIRDLMFVLNFLRLRRLGG